jgi:ribosomal protein L40E
MNAIIQTLIKDLYCAVIVIEEVNLNKKLCMSCIVHNHANTFIDNRYYVLCQICYAKYHEE